MLRLAVVLLLLVPFQASGEVRIAQRHRVKNRPNACAWASLETVGNHAGYPTAGLVDYYQARGQLKTSIVMLKAQLEELKIPYQSAPTTADMKAATDAGLPVIVGVHHWNGLGLHAVLVVDVTAEHIVFLDSNRPEDNFRFTVRDFEAIAAPGFALAIGADRGQSGKK